MLGFQQNASAFQYTSSVFLHVAVNHITHPSIVFFFFFARNQIPDCLTHISVWIEISIMYANCFSNACFSRQQVSQDSFYLLMEAFPDKVASHTDSLSPVITLGFSEKDVETLCMFYLLLRHFISCREVEDKAASAHQRALN